MVQLACGDYVFYSRLEHSRLDVDKMVDSITSWRWQYPQVACTGCMPVPDPWPACVDHHCSYELGYSAGETWFEQVGLSSWAPNVASVQADSIELEATCTSVDDCHTVTGACTGLGFSTPNSDSTRMQFVVDSLDVFNEILIVPGKTCWAENYDYVPTACEDGLCQFEWVER